MLFVIQQMVGVEVLHDVTGQDVFHLLTQDAGQGHWSIVNGFIFISFLKNRCDVGFLPSVWGLALAQ